ncbi:MAG: signal recognition particle-docking protein FtsY [Candidatus Micrarchaeota archaeon]
MFDFLRKKVKEFVSAVVGAEEEKPAEPAPQAPPERQAAPETTPEQPSTTTQPAAVPVPVPEEKPAQAAAPPAVVPEPPIPEKPQEPVAPEPVKAVLSEAPKPDAPVSQPAPRDEDGEEFEEEEIEEIVGETEEGRLKRDREDIERRIVMAREKEAVAKKVFVERAEQPFLTDERQRDLKPKLGIFSQLRGAFTGQVEISEKEAEPLFRDFEIALLESDVSLDTAQALVADLRRRLVGRKVARGSMAEEVGKEIAFALAQVMQGSKRSLYDLVSEAKSSGRTPFVILFLGPNGAGKTTTIAKVGHLLKQRGFSSVISASDTFRAAAIEQAVHHGEKLGIKVVRHDYGADPAAVAFDAIAHAKKQGIDTVLVDTAGRQETNKNLLAEMEKIVRITRPGLKLFVAEAIAGASLVTQVKAFNEKLNIDGLILTKLDCDAKGGGSISIAYECRLPIFFVGTGQGYDDLKEFNDEWIIRNVLAE